MSRSALACLVTLLTSCVAEEDLESETVQPIIGNTQATQSHANRAVAMVRNGPYGWYLFCTGTLIDDNHVLTAAHCQPTVNDRVYFYTQPDEMESGRMRQIVQTFYRPGVVPLLGDEFDSNGDLADIAIVRLNATVGAPAVIAAMRWTYPGSGEQGVEVGGGLPHDLYIGGLFQFGDVTLSADDAGGDFLTALDTTEDGDSGGPFYYNGLWVTGVLRGGIVSGGLWHNRYTSVPFHLSWILNTIGYQWSGGVTSNAVRSGTIIAQMTKPLNVCKYACDRTTTCVAYNHLAAVNLCQTLSSVTSYTASSSWTSDAKW